ncbi:MAG: alpha/beta hydrolase [Bacillota bacterium]
MKTGSLHNKIVIIIVAALIMCFVFSGTAMAASGPSQPTSGPGGSNYLYSSVKSENHGFGDRRYGIYEPSPKATTALPVIVFLHGYMSGGSFLSDEGYREFINHMVKKGYIVIFPYYQGLLTLPCDFESNAAYAIRSALKHIKSNPSDHAQPKYDSSGNMYFGIAGHSAGGQTTANLAAAWSKDGIPKPKAICVIEPGVDYLIPWNNLGNIPSDIYMQVIVGDLDLVVFDRTARELWEKTPQIPASHKDWILMKSDCNGLNCLTADHFAPAAGLFFTPDALDFYGTYKWCVALMNYANFGTDGTYALGNTADQRFMGLWSDGKAVKEPVISDTPVWP